MLQARLYLTGNWQAFTDKYTVCLNYSKVYQLSVSMEHLFFLCVFIHAYSIVYVINCAIGKVSIFVLLYLVLDLGLTYFCSLLTLIPVVLDLLDLQKMSQHVGYTVHVKQFHCANN